MKQLHFHTTWMLPNFMLLAILLAFVSVKSTAFPFGAPISSCIPIIPHHDHIAPMTTNPPTIFRVSDTTYTPGMNITIEVESQVALAGFGVAAHRVVGDTEELLGQFSNYTLGLKAVNCLGGKQNFVTQFKKLNVKKILVTWTAPPRGAGTVFFQYTLVKNFEEFWVHQKSDSITGPGKTGTSTKTNFSPMDISFGSDVCGETKGCVLFPQGCWGTDCDMALSYKMEDDIVHFEMMAVSDGYISVGFSNDRSMGLEETADCIYSDSVVRVQRGYNPALYSSQQYSTVLKNKSSSYTDGRIYCSFNRPVVASLHYSKPIITDLRDMFYIFLARGHNYHGYSQMAEHSESPFISSVKVDLKTVAVHRGDALRILTKSHGCLMSFGWIFLSSISLVIARYYRRGNFASLACGRPSWLLIHNLLMYGAAVFMAVGFVIIFCQVLAFSTMNLIDLVHGVLGCIMMGGVLFMILAGLLRPKLGSKFRPYFNVIHRFSGKILHLTAAVTMILGFASPKMSEGARRFGFIVVGLWFGMQVAFELFLEVFSRICAPRLEEDSKKSRVFGLPTTNWPKYLFACYACILLVFALSAWIPIIIY